LKKLADSWTDEFTRLEQEADFWEKLQKQWDDTEGLVLCCFIIRGKWQKLLAHEKKTRAGYFLCTVEIEDANFDSCCVV